MDASEIARRAQLDAEESFGESERRFGTEEMILNVGPQHPATHGVFRLLATIDGEKLLDAEPIIGYM
ncbi:MAG: NADH-quinone oxidoreductase subunit D, partial [Actinobacteria bacterium]|nr:NADH-quinone oxidoreductase subunit D [Actinomycetota bacterium]